MIGFVTSKWLASRKIDQTDWLHLQQHGAQMDSNETGVCYILTLGVHPAYRGRGLARSLLNLVKIRAQEARCSLIYLHVLSSNSSAIKLYSSSGYECLALLKDFYYINTGRQPDPRQTRYDALILAYRLHELPPHTFPSPSHSAAYPNRDQCLPSPYLWLPTLPFTSCWNPQDRRERSGIPRNNPQGQMSILQRWFHRPP